MEKLLHRHRKWLEALAVACVAVLGLVALHALIQEVHIRDIKAALHALDTWRIAAALGLTALSYFLLTLYDVLALRIIDRPLPYRTAALASLTSYTLSHNLGFSLLTGGSARYRIYTAAGLMPADIVRVIAAASMTFWSGVIMMAGIALLAHPALMHLGPLTLTPVMQRMIGVALLTGLAGLAMLLHVRKGIIQIWHWHVPRPSAKQAMMQPVLAALDLAAASAALYFLVPGASADQFPLFFLGYALAMVTALLTHVPGGIGVFEAVMVAALPGVDHAQLLAALILYRLIYYILPLLVAATALAIHEHRRLRQSRLARLGTATLGAASMITRGIAPLFLSIMVFLGGVVLLVSGSLPAIPDRLHMLRHILPLPFVEASHIAASLVGTGLLLLAPGLYRRLDAAFLLTRTLLISGAIFSLFKGFDYEEAIILSGMAGVLQLARPAFYRRTALTSALGNPGSIAAIASFVALAIWLGFFAYRHVSYQQDLWWQFTWNGNASRFLRATFAIAVALLCVSVMRLFGHAQPPAATPGDMAIKACEPALQHASRTDAFLALTGDKRFLRSASGDALLMYQVQGQSWIVMGDPIGPQGEWPDLLWRIREMADAAQGRLLLYQIGKEVMPLAVDLGLQLIKYGEEAKVALPDFSLDRPELKSLRYAERRAMREGASFAIIPSAQVRQHLPELRALSDSWLKAKAQSEKAFSIGRFDPHYLMQFDCATVLYEGRIVAFANIWATPNRQELSVDLMRHAETMPYGTMDFLFAHLMQWGQQQGYQWFNLGLAPLSGIEARRLAPIWARIGGLLYRHGDAIYSFEGLRAYKDKFAPEWEARYIAAPYGLGMFRALLDLQTLVGGGRMSVATPKKLALVA
ncbi:hypothetical protein NT2_09_01100 [Caenibius tardaugens NBRC 16725]|uniref:Phosphatidylglycerol lysyltransferase n=1 Tax=Caenibius tardaugens NBRC 16725 TaxID=1219035 RepID=U2YPC6_9SPHN|nr:bifunctional lysylphosphatidylglycerol flippase/synthetase MprF [Caenibius tardaugens]AZI35406.1 bifunctional lysylphosphatidylglycerol flippase/synthetase MprF [Caenibius tardaugens NBRC 16725]GAD50502.1 hypothetical protein NT2_09_01100 [Caenibius tardaugens NBRC 16725]